MSQPLSGMRILDLSRLFPGAYALQMVADYGADVIKIEEPGSGDYGRFMPPQLAGGMSLYFVAMNHTKQRMWICALEWRQNTFRYSCGGGRVMV
jgi:alpha-methylacyl-CoA racemase